MKSVSIKIENDFSKSKSQTVIKAVEQVFEGESLEKAVGFAMKFAYDTITAQYDAPKVTIADVVLTDAAAKKFKMNFIAFRVEFPKVRESILAELALTSEEAGVEYMRRTDINGVFTNQSKFTTEQVAAQAKERLRVVSDITRWVKADAVDSVVPESVQQRRALLAEMSKQKRIAAKAAAVS